jgi:hypothetical protein
MHPPPPKIHYSYVLGMLWDGTLRKVRGILEHSNWGGQTYSTCNSVVLGRVFRIPLKTMIVRNLL